MFQGQTGSRPITPEVKSSSSRGSRPITPEVKASTPEVKASPVEPNPSPLPPVENDKPDQNCKPEVDNPVEEDDDEWEYEYEVEDEPENDKADETALPPEEETRVKVESGKIPEEEICQHEPETTISDKGFKTTAV